MTICIIPARFNSSRFPGKLLALASGKTVLQRTLERARACPQLDAVYVATDDERIAEHVRKLGAEPLWTSKECPNGTERIQEALKKNPHLQKASCIVNVQGDHPCTEPATLAAIALALQSDTKAEMATAVFPLRSREDFFSPHIVKCVFDEGKNALYFSRSPIPYHRSSDPLKAFGHVGVYAYRTEFLLHGLEKASPLQLQEDLEQLKVLERGHRIKVAVVDEMSLSVDTPEDLVKLEQYLCQ